MQNNSSARGSLCSHRRAGLLLCRVAVRVGVGAEPAACCGLRALKTQQEGNGRGPDPVPRGKSASDGELFR